VRNAQGTTISGGDEQFKQLFADWKTLDGDTKASTPTPTTIVSIPSRMPLNNAALTSGFGMRTHPVLGVRRGHKGIDLAAPTGTPIYATADGIVSKAQRFSSYGLYVSIEHGAQLQTRFAHMSRIAVANGERVKKGDIIGYVGSTGRSTGPHLHYEVRVAGKAVNPIPYMKESEAQRAYAVATEAEGARGGE
jgi:murein DD-endopeptidase MepM/ murein hydrolase activator NlpD